MTGGTTTGANPLLGGASSAPGAPAWSPRSVGSRRTRSGTVSFARAASLGALRVLAGASASRSSRSLDAVGALAVGALAVGALAVGVLAVGALAVGALAVGAFAFGVLAFGALAFGVLAVGVLAVGVLAFGVLAVGALAFGALAITAALAEAAAASTGLLSLRCVTALRGSASGETEMVCISNVAWTAGAGRGRGAS
jgi:hypothetical protein